MTVIDHINKGHYRIGDGARWLGTVYYTEGDRQWRQRVQISWRGRGNGWLYRLDNSFVPTHIPVRIPRETRRQAIEDLLAAVEQHEKENIPL